MELALYEPESGYYSRDPETPGGPGFRSVGRGGDFFTSVSVGETFGFLLAEAIIREWEHHFGRPESLVIVEQGAHDGRLARDILAALGTSPRARGVSWDYRIIEPRPALRGILTRNFEGAPFQPRIVASAEEAQASQGIFLCNELLDAFPVDRLVFQGGRWSEEQVGIGEPGFRWVIRPLRPEYESITASYGEDFPDGYRTEVCPGLAAWTLETAGLFQNGLWWIFDYGHESADYRDPSRRGGSLRAFRGQQGVEDLLDSPGEQDLTADVDFTRLGDLATAAGLKVRRFTDQHHFLIETARPWLASIDGTPPDALNRKRLRQFQTLTHPAMMGRQFKVMELARGPVGA